MRWGILGLAATAVGGIAYYLFVKRNGRSPVRQSENRLDEVTEFFANPIAKFDDEIETFVSDMSPEDKTLFYECHDDFQNSLDIRDDLKVLWMITDHPEFFWYLNYFGTCLSLMFFVINRRRRGIELPEFEACMAETIDIYRDIVSVIREQMETTYPVFKERGVRHKAFKLLNMILARQNVFAERQVV